MNRSPLNLPAHPPSEPTPLRGAAQRCRYRELDNCHVMDYV
ncbi:protein of unknown function [Candidatus Methylomirabilis oxygeniifera]|uniref:Uncharacterized protein n=1 Tax=Methylomirabilis oxygeniifera TaxID=671143 RepID=D5MJJ3_METO1|nr:protein of unknown function [Candidatus Methylomirabilis oxyfera]